MALIRLISVGSRGDLEPYLVLLQELQRRGHSVTLIGSTNFADAAQKAAIAFAPLPGDFRDLLGSPAGLALMQGKPVRLVNDALLQQWLTTAREAIRGCDLLLVPPLALWAYHLAEAEGCRFAVLSPIPVVATGAFPFLKFPARKPSPGRLKRRLNRLSYQAFRLIKWRQDSGVIQAFRSQQLGLPRLPWSGAGARRDAPPPLQAPPILHLFSRHVLERPADWPAHVQITGYCFNPTSTAQTYSPPADLQDFLAAGPPPFYAGFGSMIPRHPESLAAVLVEAARLAGQRLILSPGWGRVVPAAALPSTVFVLEECPHDWLFPQLRGAVHHGGAGTTAATLRSGIPSTVVAFFADQPAWGRTLEALGVSPATHHHTTLTAPALAEGLRSMAQIPSYRCRAEQLRDQLATEDGLATAVAALEALLEPQPLVKLK